jgi:hypothetical protein
MRVIPHDGVFPMNALADEPVELLSLSVADLEHVCAASPSEAIDNHFRDHGGGRIHIMRFVGGGHFTVTYNADGQPQAYDAAGVRFVRWDAETLAVSALSPVQC